jgi:hypothetical protein
LCGIYISSNHLSSGSHSIPSLNCFFTTIIVLAFIQTFIQLLFQTTFILVIGKACGHGLYQNQAYMRQCQVQALIVAKPMAKGFIVCKDP